MSSSHAAAINASAHHSSVIDLEMSDQEYLELLMAGRDPVRESLYVQELIGCNFPAETARQVAPLFDKAEPTLADKILIGQAIRHIWENLITPQPAKQF